MFDNNYREFNQRFGINPLKIDEVSTNLVFIGYALNTGSDITLPIWKIRKFEKTGSVWEMTWADGDELYDNIWTNRNFLIYI